jgi:hypothetical protein
VSVIYPRALWWCWNPVLKFTATAFVYIYFKILFASKLGCQLHNDPICLINDFIQLSIPKTVKPYKQKRIFFSVSFSIECCFPLSGFLQCFKIQTISHILLNAQIRPEKTQDRPKNNRQAQKSPPPLMYTIRTNRYKLIKIDTLKEYAEMNS